MSYEQERDIRRIRSAIEANLHNCSRSFEVVSGKDVNAVDIMRELIDKGSIYNFMIKGLRFITRSGSPTVTFEVDYTHGRFTLRYMLMQVEEKAAELCKKLLRPQMSPLLKTMVVHNYLVDTVEYDFNSRVNPLRFTYAHSAYGALIEHKSVCQGIADAFKLIMDAAGETCFNVHGDADGGNSTGWGGHAWNMIALREGFYTHVDVTFDIGVKAVDKYMYFVKSSRQISGNHRWKNDLYPRAEEEYDAARALRRELSAKGKLLRESGVPDKYLRF